MHTSHTVSVAVAGIYNSNRATGSRRSTRFACRARQVGSHGSGSYGGRQVLLSLAAPTPDALSAGARRRSAASLAQ
jgi:hypothetical protein